MNTRQAPLVIRAFSFLFLFMGLVSPVILALAWMGAGKPDTLRISFVSNSVTFHEHPLLFTTFALYFIFAGAVALAIILKRKMAYDLAAVYCVAGLLFFGALTIMGIGATNNSPIAGVFLLILTLGWFLFHVLRRRTQWVRD